jgi:hypothetical protein
MSYTLAEAQCPTPFAEVLIARLATGLKSADREPFRLAAESALAARPLRCWGTARSTALSTHLGAKLRIAWLLIEQLRRRFEHRLQVRLAGREDRR